MERQPLVKPVLDVRTLCISACKALSPGILDHRGLRKKDQRTRLPSPPSLACLYISGAQGSALIPDEVLSFVSDKQFRLALCRTWSSTWIQLSNGSLLSGIHTRGQASQRAYGRAVVVHSGGPPLIFRPN